MSSRGRNQKDTSFSLLCIQGTCMWSVRLHKILFKGESSKSKCQGTLYSCSTGRHPAGGPVTSRAEIPECGQAAVLTTDFFCLLNPLSSKTSEARSQTWLHTAVGMAVLEPARPHGGRGALSQDGSTLRVSSRTYLLSSPLPLAGVCWGACDSWITG